MQSTNTSVIPEVVFNEMNDLIPHFYSRVDEGDLRAINQVCRMLRNLVLDGSHNTLWLEGTKTLTKKRVKEYQDRMCASGTRLTFEQALGECLRKGREIEEVRLSDVKITPELMETLLAAGSRIQRLYIKKGSSPIYPPQPPFQLARLSNLRVLEIIDSNLGAILVDMKNMASLRRIYISNTSLPPSSSLEGAVNLEEAAWENCRTMTHLPAIAGCNRLRNIEVATCKNLLQAPDLRNLALLERVHFLDCDRMRDAPPVEGSNRLRTYLLQECPSIELGPDLRDLQALEDVGIYGARLMRTAPLVRGSASLKLFAFQGSEQLTEAPDLCNLANLREVSVKKMERLPAGPAVDGCRNLVKYELAKCPRLTHLPALIGLPEFRELRVISCDLEQRPQFIDCPKIQVVKIK